MSTVHRLNARNRTGYQRILYFREPPAGARRYTVSGNILCEQYAEFFSGKGVSSTGFPPLQGSLFYTVREIHSIRLYRRDREAVLIYGKQSGIAEV